MSNRVCLRQFNNICLIVSYQSHLYSKWRVIDTKCSLGSDLTIAVCDQSLNLYLISNILFECNRSQTLTILYKDSRLSRPSLNLKSNSSPQKLFKFLPQKLTYSPSELQLQFVETYMDNYMISQNSSPSVEIFQTPTTSSLETMLIGDTTPWRPYASSLPSKSDTETESH